MSRPSGIAGVGWHLLSHVDGHVATTGNGSGLAFASAPALYSLRSGRLHCLNVKRDKDSDIVDEWRGEGVVQSRIIVTCVKDLNGKMNEPSLVATHLDMIGMQALGAPSQGYFRVVLFTMSPPPPPLPFKPTVSFSFTHNTAYSQ